MAFMGGKVSAGILRAFLRSRSLPHSFSTRKTARSFAGRRTFDTVIIGGGPVGCSIALHLASLGHSNVLVLERDARYTSASAMLSAGGIRQQFSVPENIRMSMYGAEVLTRFDELFPSPQASSSTGDAAGTNPLQFHQHGYLFLASERGAPVLESNNLTQRQCGADWIILMTQEQLSERFPWLNLDQPECVTLGSFSSRNEGYFDPWSLVQCMKRRAVELGVTFAEGAVVGARATSVTSGSHECRIDCVKVQNVDGTVEEVSAGVYVNAAGAWAGALVDLFASSTPRPKAVKPLPVKPRKRCIFNVHCPGLQAASIGYPVPPSSTPLVIDPSGVYFRPEGRQGRFLMGVSPGEEEDPDCLGSPRELDDVDHHLFEERIWPVLAERVPAFEELKVTSSWAGYYDYNTFDQNAIIGFHSELRNLMLCNGFSGHGLQQAGAAGRGVAELLTSNSGGTPAFSTLDLTRFSFQRVLENKPIHEEGIV